MSEFELRHGEKKKSMKFEIQLVDEQEELEKIDDQVGAMDDEEIDAVDLDDIGVGKRKTLAPHPDRKMTGGHSAASRQGTIYGASRTQNDFIDRFTHEREIAQDLEKEKKNDPARWYRTMNFELDYMKKLQEQRDRIIMLDPNKQTPKPAITRVSRCTFYFCKSVFCDVQTAFFTFCMLVSLVFWIVSVVLGNAPQEEYDPVVIPDVDPSKPVPSTVPDAGL